MSQRWQMILAIPAGLICGAAIGFVMVLHDHAAAARVAAPPAALGEYLGRLASDGPMVWRFQDGERTCYATSYGYSGGISCP